jgi:hypothetical protein
VDGEGPPVLDFSLAMEQVRVLLESSVWMEGDLLVLDFSLAMEQMRVLLESSVVLFCCYRFFQICTFTLTGKKVKVN